MSVFVITTGVVCHNPERRTSKTGNPYGVATIRVNENGGQSWWKLIGWRAQADAVANLKSGDIITVRGTFLMMPGSEERDPCCAITVSRVDVETGFADKNPQQYVRSKGASRPTKRERREMKMEKEERARQQHRSSKKHEKPTTPKNGADRFGMKEKPAVPNFHRRTFIHVPF